MSIHPQESTREASLTTATLTPVHKENPAHSGGERTIWGYYHEGDAAILAQFYPQVGKSVIAKIAGLMNFPRLLEVAGVVELVERYLERSFTALRNVSISASVNPLSILFWNKDKGRVERIVTPQTERLHKPMEKYALRAGSNLAINDLLDKEFGVQVTFGCSCCGIAVATEDLETLYASDYYKQREGFGRFFDSDVLGVGDSPQLFKLPSLTAVSNEILEASADFGRPEVVSYLRFERATDAALAGNPVQVNPSAKQAEVEAFLTGK